MQHRIMSAVLCLFMFLAAASSGPGGQKDQPLVFRSHVVNDTQFMGMEVLRMLIPRDWVFDGGLIWNFSKNPPEPFIVYTVTSPDGTSVLQQFPQMNMSWSQDQMMQSSNAQAGFTIMQPMGAIDFLKNVFIPQVRRGVSGLKFLGSQPLPEVARNALAMSNMTMQIYGSISPFTFPYELRADAGSVGIEYVLNGRRVTEEFVATVNYNISILPTMSGMNAQSVGWTPVVLSIRAPAEEMAAKTRLFQISLISCRPNPVWNVSYTRLCAIVTRDKLRRQQEIFARYQQIRKTLQECDDIIMQTYENRSASQDRMFDKYTQVNRGVETYIDPVNNLNVNIPTGYDNVWTNGLDYVFTDSPSFNPNSIAAGNWQQMTRKP